MMKKLDIPMCFMGLKHGSSDCFTHAFGAASSHFGSHFYYLLYYYNFLYENWDYLKTNESKEEVLLRKLGFCLSSLHPKNLNEFREDIISILDHDNPAILIFPYDLKPYAPIIYPDNPNANPVLHPIIINGYNIDDRGEYLYGKTNLHMDEDEIIKHLSFMPLVTIEATMESFYYIFDQHKKFWSNEYSGMVLNISPTDISKQDFLYYIESLNTFISLPLKKHSENLIAIINQRNNKNYISNAGKIIKQRYCLYYESLYYIIDQLLHEYEENKKIKDNVNRHKTKREAYVNKIIISLYKDNITNSIYSSFVESLYKLDEEIYYIIKSLLNNYRVNISKELINFALTAKLSADSETIHQKTGKTMNVERLISGKNSNQETDAWISSDESLTHWIQADLQNERCIKKVVLYHEPMGEIAIISYEILVSVDSISWDQIEFIDNNASLISYHSLNNVICRYIKINILQSNKMDRHARLYGLEIWGE